MKKNLLQAVLVGLASLLLCTQASAANNNDLVYHGHDAPVMRGLNYISVYSIYWLPSNLQDGTPVGKTNQYVKFQNQFLFDAANATGLAGLANQYYRTAYGRRAYAMGKLMYAGSIVDTSPYPTTGCAESMLSTANCLEDDDIQTKISQIIEQKKWPVNSSTVYLVYTANGEDVCDGKGNCTTAGNSFCGYHNAILQPQNDTFVAYAALPYTGDNGNCGTGIYPQNYPDGEIVANTAITQIFAMITNPLHNAWYTKSGLEIGDLCKGVTASTGNTWNNGTANHMWGGHFYSIQPMYDNHLHACVDSDF